MLFKKALINFAMIQTVVMATSLSLALQIPAMNPWHVTFLFLWLVAGGLSLIPSVAVSFAFAAMSKD